MKSHFFIFLLFIGIIYPHSGPVESGSTDFGSEGSVLIYQSGACGHCVPYLQELMPVLQDLGYTDIHTYDFLNNASYRADVLEIHEQFNVPLRMQGHMLTLIDGKYLFEGHVPVHLIRGFLEDGDHDFIVVTQDSMEQNAPSYLMLLENAEIKECSSDTPIAECESSSGVTGSNIDFVTLLPFVLIGVILVVLVVQLLRGK